MPAALASKNVSRGDAGGSLEPRTGAGGGGGRRGGSVRRLGLIDGGIAIARRAIGNERAFRAINGARDVLVRDGLAEVVRERAAATLPAVHRAGGVGWVRKETTAARDGLSPEDVSPAQELIDEADLATGHRPVGSPRETGRPVTGRLMNSVRSSLTGDTRVVRSARRPLTDRARGDRTPSRVASRVAPPPLPPRAFARPTRASMPDAVSLRPRDGSPLPDLGARLVVGTCDVAGAGARALLGLVPSDGSPPPPAVELTLTGVGPRANDHPDAEPVFFPANDDVDAPAAAAPPALALVRLTPDLSLLVVNRPARVADEAALAYAVHAMATEAGCDSVVLAAAMRLDVGPGGEKNAPRVYRFDLGGRSSSSDPAATGDEEESLPSGTNASSSSPSSFPRLPPLDPTARLNDGLIAALAHALRHGGPRATCVCARPRGAERGDGPPGGEIGRGRGGGGDDEAPGRGARRGARGMRLRRRADVSAEADVESGHRAERRQDVYVETRERQTTRRNEAQRRQGAKASAVASERAGRSCSHITPTASRATIGPSVTFR